MEETAIGEVVCTGRIPPSDLEQVWIVARYDIMKQIRRKRLLGMIIIIILMAVVSVVINPLAGIPYSQEPFQNNGLIILFFFLQVVTVLLAVFFAADSIVGEYQQRTGYLLFPNPIKKSSMLLGKFLSASIISIFILGILYFLITAIGYSDAYLAGGSPGFDFKILEAFGFTTLFAVSLISLTFIISSVAKGVAGAMVLSFFLPQVAFGLVDAMLPTMLPSFETGITPTYFYGVVGNMIYPDSLISILMSPITYVMGAPDPTVSGSLVGFAVWIIVPLIIAYIIFLRREMS